LATNRQLAATRRRPQLLLLLLLLLAVLQLTRLPLALRLVLLLVLLLWLCQMEKSAQACTFQHNPQRGSAQPNHQHQQQQVALYRAHMLAICLLVPTCSTA
jgi:hypothetical protein